VAIRAVGGNSGVFDFEGALFGTLWETHSREDFLAYMRYCISDHRILWAEFQIEPGPCDVFRGLRVFLRRTSSPLPVIRNCVHPLWIE